MTTTGGGVCTCVHADDAKLLLFYCRVEVLTIITLHVIGHMFDSLAFPMLWNKAVCQKATSNDRFHPDSGSTGQCAPILCSAAMTKNTVEPAS